MNDGSTPLASRHRRANAHPEDDAGSLAQPCFQTPPRRAVTARLLSFHFCLVLILRARLSRTRRNRDWRSTAAPRP